MPNNSLGVNGLGQGQNPGMSGDIDSIMRQLSRAEHSGRGIRPQLATHDGVLGEQYVSKLEGRLS